MGQPHLFICTLFPSRLSHEKTVIRPSLFFTISITALPHQFPLMVYWTCTGGVKSRWPILSPLSAHLLFVFFENRRIAS